MLLSLSTEGVIVTGFVYELSAAPVAKTAAAALWLGCLTKYLRETCARGGVLACNQNNFDQVRDFFFSFFWNKETKIAEKLQNRLPQRSGQNSCNYFLVEAL